MAEFITSRPYPLPESFSGRPWWNVWKKKMWPYEKVCLKDVLYFFDRSAGRLVYNTRVSKVERFRYGTIDELFDRLERFFGTVDRNDAYTRKKGSQGYCLAYQVDDLASVQFEKPPDLTFPRLGWLELDLEPRKRWFGAAAIEPPDANSGGTLDDILDSIAPLSRDTSALQAINDEMQDVEPLRTSEFVSRTIRDDGKIVRALKQAVGFQCQFPGCAARIKMKNGSNYVEVAHVKPVSCGGKSILGNLIVLCPNHHKEFDLGDLQIDSQSASEVRGRLNGVTFTIHAP